MGKLETTYTSSINNLLGFLAQINTKKFIHGAWTFETDFKEYGIKEP